MGLVEAAIATPLRRLPDKQVAGTEHGDAYEALRVPWFDEDALTLAVDAGLALGEAVERAGEVVLALDAEHTQPGLVGHALGLEAPLSTRTGPLAGLEALARAEERETVTLVLAGGTGPGGAGVAVLVAPGEGVPVQATARQAEGTLGADAGAALGAVADALPEEGPLTVPAGTPGRDRLDDQPRPAATATIGGAGPAGGLVELLDALDEAGPVRTAQAASGRAIGLAAGEGTLPVHRTPGRAVNVTVDAVDALDAETVPWHEASQGAYVSEQAYEAQPRERYGARELGEGTVAASTTIRAGPPGEFQRQHAAAGGFDVAIVEDGDTRRIHQSTAPAGELEIGDEVHRVLRRLFEMEGRWRYAVKVRPS